MADLNLKRGQTASITFALVDSAGAAFTLTGYTVTLAIAGKGIIKRITGANDSPATLGTGAFPVVAADYATLKPGSYTFEVWAFDGGSNDIPMLSGTLDVDDVPQRA